ncbi:hypothetical protein [Saccharopolyspora dendranthemae]|uniref:Uncharacterized protein n=1 Tax=Saccharopolyspora dendranthemae TaxID=1181886 RepID=A0A561U7V8_9PSEU|nr:hypothetical protein [Saccharopolyspora dendranthemae]TWF95442.1 hypothetical protein FHU35_12437 [Saccharopolyspora dendranthemae]
MAGGGWFTKLYGAGPVHLLAVVGCFALASYSALLVWEEPQVVRMAVWFGAAVVVHDLVLLPVYSLADRALAGSLRSPPKARVPIVNHVRLPVLAAGLLFLVFFPGVVQQGTATHLAATGQDQQPYLGRWLALSATFVVVSAAIYVIRRVIALRRERSRESSGVDDPT